MPGKMEKVQITANAKEAYYINGNFFIDKSQIRPTWQGQRHLKDSRTAFGFDLEQFFMPGKMEKVQITAYAKEAYYIDEQLYYCQISNSAHMAGWGTSQGFQNSLWIWSGAILYARENGEGANHRLR